MIDIAVRDHPNPIVGGQQPDPTLVLMELRADVEATGDVRSAIAALELPIGSFLDLLAFQMSASVEIEQVNAIETTRPVEIGEAREFHFFGGSPFGQFQRAIDMQAVRGRLYGAFPSSIELASSTDRAALRWFVKALGMQPLHDQFLFLWIALEILCDASSVKVEQRYRSPRCGHEIANCPKCGMTTSILLRGDTLKAFIASFGVSDEDVRRLWKFRQMIHGAIRFAPGTGEELGPLTQILRAVVAAALKGRLGFPADEPPQISMTGLTIHPSLSLGGTRVISVDDLDPLVA